MSEDRRNHIDFETFSELDVSEVGAYRYAEHPSTEPLCFAYARGRGKVRAWVPNRRSSGTIKSVVIPIDLEEDIEDEEVFFVAHNAGFERAIWHHIMHLRYGWPDIAPERWICTASMGAAVGFPRGLEAAIKRARLPDKYNKDKRGKDLLRLFAQPRKPTKADARTRIYPDDEPEKFQELVDYCKQDVRGERGLEEYLPELPPRERKVWLFDLKVNETGMPLDTHLIGRSIRVLTSIEQRYRVRCNKITGYNPTQRERILEWLDENGCTLPNLQLETVQKTLASKRIHIDRKVREVLRMRIEASRASTKKIAKMLHCVMADGRARGMYLYAGAHTLRWSSKILQLHNFIRGYDDPKIIATILEAYRSGDPDLVWALFASPIWELSKCMRGFIAAPEGLELGVVDYSQIEARNLDWHAGNEAGLEMWSDGSIDPYVVMAMKIYGKSYDEIKNEPSQEMRRIGKNTTLGAGFQMSAKAWLAYARKMGSKTADEDLAELAIGTYREVNAPVVTMWSEVNNHAIAAIAEPQRAFKWRKLTFEMVDHWLTILLPSGRRIWYPYAKLTTGRTKWGKEVEQIVFMGANHKEHTYGGKVTENVVQGTCRDIMAGGLMNASEDGFEIVGHTHDEGISLGRDIDLERQIKMMCKIAPWAKGMPLVAKGFKTPFYWKG